MEISEVPASHPDNLSKGERTRQFLVEAAFHEFVARGYHGTSMRAIAEAAGLTVGAIYNHFAGKEEIFAAVVLAYHPLGRIVPHLRAAQGDTAEALLRDAAHRFMAELQHEPGVLNLLFIELIECKGSHLGDVLANLLSLASPVLEQFADRRDELQPVTPLVLLRSFMGAMVAYYITGRLLVQAGFPSEEMGEIDTYINLYLHGVVRP